MNAHDGRLVDGGDLSSAVLLRVVESVTRNSLGSLVRDQLDGLDDTVDDLSSATAYAFRLLAIDTHLVLDTGVLSLGVFTDKDLQVSDSDSRRRWTHGVDVVVGGLVSLDGDTWSHVGVQAESPPQGQVERDVSLSDGRGEGTLERDGVLLDGVDGLLRDGRLAVDEGGGNVDLLPLDRGLESASAHSAEAFTAARKRVQRTTRGDEHACDTSCARVVKSGGNPPWRP